MPTKLQASLSNLLAVEEMESVLRPEHPYIILLEDVRLDRLKLLMLRLVRLEQPCNIDFMLVTFDVLKPLTLRLVSFLHT